MRILILKNTETNAVYGYSLPFKCVGYARFGEEGDLVTERLLQAPECTRRQMIAREIFHQMVAKNTAAMKKTVYTTYVDQSLLNMQAGVSLSWGNDHPRKGGKA